MEKGKFYTSKKGTGEIKLECVYVTEINPSLINTSIVAVLRYAGGAEIAVQGDSWDLWKEWVPEFKIGQTYKYQDRNFPMKVVYKHFNEACAISVNNGMYLLDLADLLNGTIVEVN